MSEKSKKFSEQLDKLIERGNTLKLALQLECYPEDYRARLNRIHNNDTQKVDNLLKEFPKFKKEYQAWYSEAQAVIKQVLPDRLADFISHYEYKKPRKDFNVANYMIRDYLQGLHITLVGGEIVTGAAAIPDFDQQLSMLKAAKATLLSVLLDLKAVLQAELFDSEIDAAEALAKAGHFRAAGALCGVIIEKHLRHVCEIHSVKIVKRNPGISDLSQLLKDAGITDIPQWRFIQHLADVRNICDHATGREPTKEDISDLVNGVKKVLKTVY